MEENEGWNPEGAEIILLNGVWDRVAPDVVFFYPILAFHFGLGGGLRVQIFGNFYEIAIVGTSRNRVYKQFRYIIMHYN